MSTVQQTFYSEATVIVVGSLLKNIAIRLHFKTIYSIVNILW